MRPALFLLIIPVFIVSCKENYDAPCRSLQRDTLTMPLNISGTFPYDGLDTLTFESDAGDSAFCYSYGLTALYTNYKRSGSNPECPADTTAYETLRLSINDFPDKLRAVVTTGIDGSQNYFMTVMAAGSTFGIDPSEVGVKTKLSYKDSAVLDGRTFLQVQQVTNAAGDSLYFSRARGIVRVRNGREGWTLR